MTPGGQIACLRAELGFVLIPVFGSEVCVGGGVEQKGMDQVHQRVHDETCGELVTFGMRMSRWALSQCMCVG